jgi:peptidoglycan/LPS O-acetylase OafA/YrhL
MRIEQLTFTRFIAAVGIVFFHFGKGISPFNSGILATIVNNANLGVGYFFVLSGLVMVVAYQNANKPVNTANYYFKRLAKIYPMYLLSLLVMLVLAGAINAGKLISEVFLVQSFFPDYTFAYNWPDWSLSVEVVFYLLFPIVYNHFYLKKSFRIISISVLAFWLASQLLIFAWPYSALLYSNIPFYALKFGPLFHLNEFFSGNLIGLLIIQLHEKNNPAKRKRLLFPLLLILPVSAALVLTMKAYHLKPEINLHNGLLLLLYTPCILLLALSKGRFSKVLSSKSLVFAGEISYCIYILQLPVFTVAALFIKFQNPALNFYSSLALLLVASALAYNFIEEPCRRLVKKHLLKEA